VAESERWKELERLLDRALDLAPGDRAAFLKQVCPGDPALRAEVERLLHDAESGDSFLEEPVSTYAAPLVARVAQPHAVVPGEHLGVYEIVRELGRGGRVAERLNDRVTATRSYQCVLDAWRHADPELRPYVDEARAGLARLSREPARAGE